MNPATVKTECPACGQHYSLELSESPATLTCQKCGAEFTAKAADVSIQAADDSSAALPDAAPSGPSVLTRISSFPDKLFAVGFRFGKFFAAVLALLFLIGILLGIGSFVMNLHPSIKVPSFAEIKQNAAAESSRPNDIKALDERRETEKSFGDTISDLVKKHELPASSYDEILQATILFNKDYRKSYLAGLGAVLKAAKADAENTAEGSQPISPMRAAGLYTNAFSEAQANAIQTVGKADSSRKEALTKIFACCSMLFLMLIIPALIKIEENTRPKPTP